MTSQKKLRRTSRGIAVKYAWVEQHKADWPVRLICEVLGVSASGYFENGKRKGAAKQSPPEGGKRINDEALLVHIKAIHAKVREE